MRILVVGGAGYIGTHTLIAVFSGGHEGAALDNFCNSKPEAVKRVEQITGRSVPLYECDVLDKEKLARVFAEYQPDAVIHFAGFKAAAGSVAEPLAYYRNNISGTVVLCEVMQAHGVKNLVFSSSATVYGMTNPAPLREDMPAGGCINPYGQTKFMNEIILRDLHHADNDWNITALRYFNVAGAHESGLIGDDPEGIPANIMPILTQVAIGRLPVFKLTGTDYDTPDGTCIRDYIHVTDLARGHVQALEAQRKQPGYNVYNLGTGKGSSVREIVAAFEKASGQKLPMAEAPRRPGDLAVSYAAVEKAEREIGFKARHGIDRMCADAWRWQKQNPQGL